MNQIKLFGKPIRVNKVRLLFPVAISPLIATLTRGIRDQSATDRKQLDIGANLFVGNLDHNVDERMLFDTFMSFGTLAQTAQV